MKSLRWLLFAGLFFLPLMDAGIRLFGTRILIFDIYFAALLFLALLVFRNQINLNLQTSVLMLALICTLITTWFLASIVAIRVNAAVLGAIRNMKLFIFALILALTVRKVENIGFYITGLLGAVGWVSFIGWVQSIWGNNALQIRATMQVNAVHYFGASGQYGERTVSAFGDPIMSGHFLAVGFCMALGWALVTKNIRERVWLSILAACALVPLLTSASRGPITAGFLTGSTLIFFSGIKKREIFLLTSMGMLAVLYGQSILNFLNTVSVFRVSLDRISYGLESSRWEYWVKILSMAKSYPIGVGLGNFADAAPKYIPPYLLYVNASGGLQTNIHAESMYLTQLIEVGWSGFFAFVGVVSLSVFNSWKLFLDSKNAPSETERSIRASMFGAWMSITLSMLTTYGYDNIGIAMLFWFLVGISIVSPYGLKVRITA